MLVLLKQNGKVKLQMNQVCRILKEILFDRSTRVLDGR